MTIRDLADPTVVRALDLPGLATGVMLGYHDRPDTPVPDHRGRLLRHGRRVPPRRGRLPLRAGAHRRHGRLRRREHLPRGGRGHARRPSRRHAGLHRARRGRDQGHEAGAFVVRRPGAALDEEAVKRFAPANAPAYQHPRRVWFLDVLPLASTDKIDKALLHRRAEEAVRSG